MERWEYYTTLLEAEMSDVKAEYFPNIPDGDHPKFSPFAIMPELDALGEKGWELVHMQPVVAGGNHDVLVHHNGLGNNTYWTNIYFCVLKRRM